LSWESEARNKRFERGLEEINLHSFLPGYL
jgi:hypothetical protein